MALEVNPRMNRIISDRMNRTLIHSGISSDQLKIYKGTMPTSGDFQRWNAYESSRSSDLLATLSCYQGIVDDTSAIYFDTNHPAPAPGSATGTATWAALVGSGTNNPTLVGSVSDAAGNGLFRLDNVAINTVDDVVVVGFRLQW